jgi:hypothetical protein
MAEVRIHPENSGSAGRNNHVMAPKKIHINLETQVLIGLVLGLAAGVFFGDMVAFTRIAGDAFIKLLQVTVIPYIIVSLITALGRLSYDEVKSLGIKAGGVLLILWGVGLVVVFLAPLSFPKWPSASFFSTSLAELGAVWTLLYPQFSLVSPTPVLFVDVGYAVARGEVDLANYFNAWLAGAKNQGIIDALYRYWMLGQVDKTQPPRWSIIRDVLHWIE